MQRLVKRVLTTAAISVGLLSGTGQAAIMTVDDNLADDQYLGAGTTLSGTFDLRPYLSSNSTIDWARVTFNFFDDYDPLRLTSNSGSYSSGYRRTYTNDVERVAVSTEGQSDIALTTSVIEESFNSRSVTYMSYRWVPYTRSYRCGGLFRRRTCTSTSWRRIPYTSYRTVQDIETTSIADGPFSASYLLDSEALTRLLDVGLADFQVSGEEGDSTFKNATLEASISSVPEPSVLVLLGLGLGGLVWRQRRSAAAS